MKRKNAPGCSCCEFPTTGGKGDENIFLGGVFVELQTDNTVRASASIICRPYDHDTWTMPPANVFDGTIFTFNAAKTFSRSQGNAASLTIPHATHPTSFVLTWSGASPEFWASQFQDGELYPSFGHIDIDNKSFHMTLELLPGADPSLVAGQNQEDFIREISGGKVIPNVRGSTAQYRPSIFGSPPNGLMSWSGPLADVEDHCSEQNPANIPDELTLTITNVRNASPESEASLDVPNPFVMTLHRLNRYNATYYWGAKQLSGAPYVVFAEYDPVSGVGGNAQLIVFTEADTTTVSVFGDWRLVASPDPPNACVINHAATTFVGDNADVTITA